MGDERINITLRLGVGVWKMNRCDGTVLNLTRLIQEDIGGRSPSFRYGTTRRVFLLYGTSRRRVVS